jgi:predicted alpha/beta hydrolase
MDVRSIELRTADGVVLAGTHYDAGARDALLIASAMGVKRRYYDAFARYMGERGWDVVTFDYRGIGDSAPRSLRGFEASMHDWGALDIAAAIDWITRELRPARFAYLGHSAGGQLAGLAPNIGRAERLIFVASQSGYWRLWSGIRKYGLGLLWLAMPVISRVVGYFPAKVLLMGSENLPREVASQWARWGRHPQYLWGSNDPATYARITAPLLAYSLHSDHYAPRRAVDALVAKYAGAQVTRIHREEHLGHFDAFRRGKGEGMWEEMAAWLFGVR